MHQPIAVHCQKPSAIPSHVHRLHYRWSQLEADQRATTKVSLHPFPTADRRLELPPDCEYTEWPSESSWQCPLEQGQFSAVKNVYNTIHYNTFARNGVLKLTEVELSFLSSKMTRTSSVEWAVVYLGIGNGERFRYLRDEFFPGLSVIAFDPYEDGPSYKAETHIALGNARLWNNDGTNFIFHVRRFDVDNDISLVRDQTKGKNLLLISDIRGCAFLEDGETFDKMQDLDLQWLAIQRLQPMSSLVKFDAPGMDDQFFEYPTGVVLKLVFCSYGAHELRLLIEGVPERNRRYNGWDLFKRMKLHHEHLRGQVYESTRPPGCTACLDSCFDCTVLWITVSTYAAQNNADPAKVLSSLIYSHIYTPGGYKTFKRIEPSYIERWSDVKWYLQQGMLTEAIAALEASGEADGEYKDWTFITMGLFASQPSLEQRLRRELPQPASRDDLIRLLGSLSTPFTFINTPMNSVRDDVN